MGGGFLEVGDGKRVGTFPPFLFVLVPSGRQKLELYVFRCENVIYLFRGEGEKGGGGRKGRGNSCEWAWGCYISR